MSFSKIAKVYDRFNEVESYEDWLDFTLNSVEQKPNKALDVACGTGWFPTLLNSFVNELVAIDIDEKMLEIAKLEDPNSSVIYQKADMLALEALDSDFDLVTCFADSLCFLENIEQVEKAINQMFDRLSPGGTLLFDVWTPYQITEGFKGFSYFDTDETGAILWDSEVFPEEIKVEHYLTVFDKNESNADYVRNDIVLVERTYPVAVYQTILSKLSADSIEVLVDFGETIYNPKQHGKVDRLFFRVVKK